MTIAVNTPLGKYSRGGLCPRCAPARQPESFADMRWTVRRPAAPAREIETGADDDQSETDKTDSGIDRNTGPACCRSILLPAAIL